MKAKLRTKTTVHIACPYCGKGESRVDHLFGDHLPKAVGPWACDECGRQYRLTVNSATDIDVEPFDDGSSWVKTYDLLSIPPQEKPIYFVVTGGYHSPHEEADKGMTYFYEEHTCPINWLRSVKAIISEDDEDPHGIANFVRTVDRKGLGDNPDWAVVFPEAFAAPEIDGEIASGAVEGTTDER